jgi:hypothetical protein
MSLRGVRLQRRPRLARSKWSVRVARYSDERLRLAAKHALHVRGRAAGMSVERLAARAARKLNMSWHDPDLYFFLCLLAGLAAFLAIIYECIQKFSRRKPPPVVEPRRSTVNQKAVDPPSPPKYLKNVRPLDGLQRESSRQAGKQAAERFSRLCESVEVLAPKEQASGVREYFGIFGGGRPPEGRGRKGKRP